MRFAPATLALALLALFGPASAQEGPAPRRAPETVRLTLRQCLHLALDHNVDVEISRYQPWIEDQNVLSSLGAFDHVIYAQPTVSESVTSSGTALAGAPEPETDSFTQRTGLRRTLPFGLNYDLSFSFTRSKSNSSFATINPSWSESLNLAVTMPLLRGRGEDSVYSGVVVAQNSRRIAVDRFEKSLADQVEAVVRAYWDLVFARETLEVKRQSEKVAERLLEENQKKFEKGVLARVDVTEAEAGVATQREGILTADNAVAAAMDRLKRLVDPSLLRQDVLVVPADAPRPFERELDERAALDAAVLAAFAHRPEWREFGPSIDSQELALRKSRRDLLPRLDLTATGALTGLDDSFGASNKDVRSRDFHDWSLGIVFEWPFENRAARGALQRAELERRRLDLQKRSLEDQILVEVRAAVRDIKTTEKRIEATRRARVLAQERFEGEMNRREAGLRTTFHVLDSEERLTEAKTNELKALIDYGIAQMMLQKSSGTLLEQNGVLVQENLTPRLGR